MECVNYDICDTCHSMGNSNTLQNPDHKNDHMFLKICKASQSKKIPLLFNRENWVNKGIICYHCNKQNIIGWRYLCVQCGINICEVCEHLGVHTLTHPLLKMTPIQEPLSSVPGVTFAQSNDKPSPFTQPTQQSLFGFSQSTPQQSVFGYGSTQSAPQSAPQQSVFGYGSTQSAPQSAPQQSVFGYGSTQSAPQQSLFGYGSAQSTQQSAPQSAPQQSLFGYGSAQSATQSATQSAPQQSLFSFGSQQTSFGKK